MGEGAASAAFHEFLAGVFAYFSTKAFLANVVVNVLLGEFELRRQRRRTLDGIAVIELLQGLLFCLTARPTTRWRTEDFDFATLVHVRAKGDCLTPYFDDGDLLFVAQGLAPQHRELVLVDIGFYSPGGLGSPPSTTWRRMVKQFIVDDAGVAWVANNSDAVPARLHRVKGVVVAYKRRRHWLRPSVRRMDFSANVRSGLQGRDQDGHGLVG